MTLVVILKQEVGCVNLFEWLSLTMIWRPTLAAGSLYHGNRDCKLT